MSAFLVNHKQLAPPVQADIVLVGGGHAHALFIRQWAKSPLLDVRITLISNVVMTPYSGMLPGLLAGHYGFEETHIDLPKLCNFAGVCFVLGTVQSVDTVQRRVVIQGRPSLAYDAVSINTGVTPKYLSNQITGGIPVKPIADFYQYWCQAISRWEKLDEVSDVAVVGAGAAGVEVVLAMAYAVSNNQQIQHKPRFHLVFRSKNILSTYPAGVIAHVEQALQHSGISLHANFDVKKKDDQALFSTEGEVLHCEDVFWCTPASAPSWPADSGLVTDKEGFIVVDKYLRCKGFKDVFACGDVASFQSNPIAKAGVYAVRQAPVLFENIRRLLSGGGLKEFRPQSQFLSLLALGGKRAIAIRHPFYWQDDWVWSWKNAIDQQFMSQVKELPDMNVMRSEPALTRTFPAKMRCSGCGAKVGENILSAVLKRIDVIHCPDLISEQGDDSSAIKWNQSNLLVQSVDGFRSPLSDPFISGQLAALHALSDIYASGAEPHSALAMLTFPHAAPKPLEENLYQVMSGITQVLNQAECALIGGHTAEAAELSISLSVNAQSMDWKAKKGLQAGDVLILTKPIGTGVLLAGLSQGLADSRDVYAALDVMLTSNRVAANVMGEFNIHALTDITGFGLAGHIKQMIGDENYEVALLVNKLPVYKGVRELIEKGVGSSLLPSNWQGVQSLFLEASSEPSFVHNLLIDPQTSGGLLVALAEADAAACLEALHRAGESDASIVAVVNKCSQARLSLR